MEWETEPNQIEEEIDGYKIKIARSISMGHLCGYVFLDKNHKYHGTHYDNIEVDVHGGLTFSEQDGEYWKIGFDCAHYDDLVPYAKFSNKWTRDKEYRNVNYVKSELKSLVEQLNKVK